MHARAASLIETLRLSPHPEGGHFRELYRSERRVHPVDAASERAALTTIYFLLASAEVSRWHLVRYDEVWHYYEGDLLELFIADAEFTRVTRHVLGPVVAAQEPVHVVPGGRWQAARPAGAYTLVGCTVAPGFEFCDFEMLRDDPERMRTAAQRLGELAALV